MKEGKRRPDYGLILTLATVALLLAEWGHEWIERFRDADQAALDALKGVDAFSLWRIIAKLWSEDCAPHVLWSPQGYEIPQQYYGGAFAGICHANPDHIVAFALSFPFRMIALGWALLTNLWAQGNVATLVVCALIVIAAGATALNAPNDNYWAGAGIFVLALLAAPLLTLALRIVFSGALLLVLAVCQVLLLLVGSAFAVAFFEKGDLAMGLFEKCKKAGIFNRLPWIEKFL